MTARKATNYFNEHPEKLAQLCSRQYSADTVEKDSVLVKQGEPQISVPEINVTVPIDSVLLSAKTDSIRLALVDSFSRHPLVVRARCPPTIIRTDTIERIKFLQITNKAKENYLLFQRDSVSRQLTIVTSDAEQWKQKAQKRQKILFELTGIIALFILLKLLIGYLKLKGKAIPFL